MELELKDQIKEAEAAVEKAQGPAIQAGKVLREAQDRLRALKDQAHAECMDALLELLTGDQGGLVIDTFAPKHSRSSCSDVDLNNLSNGCVRCTLLYARRQAHWDDYDVEFVVTLAHR